MGAIRFVFFLLVLTMAAFPARAGESPDDLESVAAMSDLVIEAAVLHVTCLAVEQAPDDSYTTYHYLALMDVIDVIKGDPSSMPGENFDIAFSKTVGMPPPTGCSLPSIELPEGTVGTHYLWNWDGGEQLYVHWAYNGFIPSEDNDPQELPDCSELEEGDEVDPDDPGPEEEVVEGDDPVEDDETWVDDSNPDLENGESAMPYPEDDESTTGESAMPYPEGDELPEGDSMGNLSILDENAAGGCQNTTAAPLATGVGLFVLTALLIGIFRIRRRRQ